jgi:hypothetical protein
MKNVILSFIVMIGGVMLSSSSCKKEKVGIDGLPAITQTGAQTFGCLIDGTLFKPKGSGFGAPIMESSYKIVNGAPQFTMRATDRSSSTRLFSLVIRSENIELKSGMMIPLGLNANGNASATYYDDKAQGTDEFITNTISKGELEVTKLDLTSQIVSGKFWFNAINDQGKVVKITDGRFDLNFIR